MSNDKSDATFNPNYGGINGPYDRNSDPASGLADKPKKRKRIFMWFFLAVQALFIVWLIAGAMQPGASEACKGIITSEFYTQDDCETAYAAGQGIGFIAILGIWAVVDFLLVLTWAVIRLARR